MLLELRDDNNESVGGLLLRSAAPLTNKIFQFHHFAVSSAQRAGVGARKRCAYYVVYCRTPIDSLHTENIAFTMYNREVGRNRFYIAFNNSCQSDGMPSERRGETG